MDNNRANQLNPNNWRYWNSRGYSARPDNWAGPGGNGSSGWSTWTILGLVGAAALFIKAYRGSST